MPIFSRITDQADARPLPRDGEPARPSLTGVSGQPGAALCDGQLTNCVPQSGTDRRLDAQGDKLMARLVYRRVGGHALRETVLATGEAARTNTLRWEDYTQTAVDPSDDCTMWHVGDYFKQGESSYSTRIGAFRLPACEDSR